MMPREQEQRCATSRGAAGKLLLGVGGSPSVQRRLHVPRLLSLAMGPREGSTLTGGGRWRRPPFRREGRRWAGAATWRPRSVLFCSISSSSCTHPSRQGRGDSRRRRRRLGLPDSSRRRLRHQPATTSMVTS
uniref:Uncharacterized protein n=1 Tax=Oryza barthii TaxID=65489 RepID=A0A0D3FK17_9ORYZ